MSDHNSSHNTSNVNLAIFIGILVFGFIIGGFMVKVDVTLKAVDVLTLILIAGFITFVPYVASVRFYSPMVIDEAGKVFTTFSNSFEIIEDEMLGGTYALIYSGGYNSDRKYLSQHDIFATKHTQLLVCPVRMVESMANGRYLVVRGSLEEMTPEESAQFLSRESVASVLNPNPKLPRIKTASVFFAFASRTLHPDTMPEGVDLAAIMRNWQQWTGEIKDTVDRTINESARKVQFVKDIRGTGEQSTEGKLLNVLRGVKPAEEEQK